MTGNQSGRTPFRSPSPKAIDHILEHGVLTIQDFEGLCPEVNRRSLQRDLKAMLDKGLLLSEGATNQLIYSIKD